MGFIHTCLNLLNYLFKPEKKIFSMERLNLLAAQFILNYQESTSKDSSLQLLSASLPRENEINKYSLYTYVYELQTIVGRKLEHPCHELNSVRPVVVNSLSARNSKWASLHKLASSERKKFGTTTSWCRLKIKAHIGII